MTSSTPSPCVSVGGQRLWPFCPPLYHTSCELPKECKADPLKIMDAFKNHYRRWTSKMACHRNSNCLEPQSRKKPSKINLMSYSLFVKRWGIFEDTVVLLLYTVRWYCSWGFGGNMSTNEATVRVVKLPVTQMETVWL